MVKTDLLTDKKRLRKYAGGARVMPLKEGVREMYVVKQGNVDSYIITLGKKLEKRETLTPGRVFGEEGFFGGAVRRVFVASGDVVVYVIPEKSFTRLATENPHLVFELLREVSGVTPLAPPPKPAAPPKPAEKPVKPAAPEAQSGPAAHDFSASGGLLPEGHKGYPSVTCEEYAKFLYEKDYTCPNCGQKFKSHKIFLSRLVPSSPMRYDLRKFFNDFKMEWYELLTCPHCYFSMPADYFTESKFLNKKKIGQPLGQARECVALDFDAPRDIDFVFVSHYLALVCAPGYANEKQLEMHLWANLSWLYEDVGDDEMVRYAAKKSAEASEAMYMGSRLSPPQEQMICLSTGGMLYRAGEMENVMKWLFSAKTNRSGKKTYVALAENLMEQIREDAHGE